MSVIGRSQGRTVYVATRPSTRSYGGESSSGGSGFALAGAALSAGLGESPTLVRYVAIIGAGVYGLLFVLGLLMVWIGVETFSGLMRIMLDAMRQTWWLSVPWILSVAWEIASIWRD